MDLKDYPRASAYLHDALREFRRLEDTDGIADSLKDLTLLALAQGDRQEAALNGQAPPGDLPGPGPGAGGQEAGGITEGRQAGRGPGHQ